MYNVENNKLKTGDYSNHERNNPNTFQLSNICDKNTNVKSYTINNGWRVR